MDVSPGSIDHDREPTTDLMRDAIARALDGVPPDSDARAAAAYRTAIASMSSTLHRQHRRLQSLGAAGLVTAPARLEVSHRLLRMLGVPVEPARSAAVDSRWPGVVFVGCRSNVDAWQVRWIARMLRRGAIVVSSDRSASMNAIGRHLAVAPVSAGRRARVALVPHLVDRLGSECVWGRFITEMHPPAWLRPGHLPLCHEQPAGVRIVARDGMTDAPLIVRVPVLGGQVIHSVAHWWQETEPDTTELGRRPLSSAAAFSGAGIEDCGSSVGWFGSASVMLASLLMALDGALDDVEARPPAEPPPPVVELE